MPGPEFPRKRVEPGIKTQRPISDENGCVCVCPPESPNNEAEALNSIPGEDPDASQIGGRPTRPMAGPVPEGASSPPDKMLTSSGPKDLRATEVQNDEMLTSCKHLPHPTPQSGALHKLLSFDKGRTRLHSHHFHAALSTSPSLQEATAASSNLLLQETGLQELGKSTLMK